MSAYEIKKLILEKIKEYDRIIIFRHLRPDGDAVGSTKGLRAILRQSFPEKEIYLNNCDFSDYVAFLGGEDEPLSDEEYKDALGIVVDTATAQRISNPRYELCREVIKIDHHIPVQQYGTLQWVEENRSSSCEMIADFYRTFSDELKMDVEAATYIYAGMVTDSGRFRFRSVSGDTLRLAGMLLDFGIDLDTLHANLYMKEFHTLRFQAFVYQNMNITENGVVWFHVTKDIREQFSLSMEDASNCVTYMDSIKGSLIWLAFIDTDDGDARVRLRSRFVTVNQIAERHGGGGHDCASGANARDLDEIKAIVAEADAALKEYKENHEGWL